MPSKHSTSNRFEPDTPPLERAYQLSQEFVMMLAERREADLASWLTKAEQSDLPECKKWRMASAKSMRRGTAAFSSEWSQGQVEAQVNCLKRKPRIVFGRANFDLTRAARPLRCGDVPSDPVVSFCSMKFHACLFSDWESMDRKTS
jgi:hypothetical protein